ncbi:helix-turn-helix domain-containing protein [Heyndrickxia oleronia]|uniref:helix-turn-helix domain-containing protein n=1 Tax=Heyndrickxia oleronia TaxID=38875 RepID=UPI001C0F047F|nr:helix-turn-helix domain-containing protein [Heyndrickxia oleronia]MBU5210218.1 helix-turn-helix transcriptional regulator [Heyndrickxia oleronia]
MNLEYLNLGEVLNSLRVYKRIEMVDLADNVCSVEDLILFEKGKKYPTLEQLASFADKLNVELNYFFDFSYTSHFNYVKNVLNLIDHYKKQRNYMAISNIIKTEKNNPIFLHASKRQYLLWHEGICSFYLEKNKVLAIQLLRDAIKLTNPSMQNLTESEIDILASIAIIEKDDNNYNEAINLFEEAIKNIDQLPYLIDSKIRIKILYSYAQVLTKVGEYLDSITFCKFGIQTCIDNEVSYQFADLHYQIGENYIKMGNIDSGIEYMNKASFLFETYEDHEYADLVKNEKKKLLGSLTY